jgi:hypothetical protein
LARTEEHKRHILEFKKESVGQLAQFVVMSKPPEQESQIFTLVQASQLVMAGQLPLILVSIIIASISEQTRTRVFMI